MDEATVTAVKKPGFVRRHKKLVTILTIFAALAFGGNYYIAQSTKKEPLSTSSIFDTVSTESETDTGTGPVAKVNGVEISRIDYQNAIRELTLTLLQQGYTTTDATVASQIRQQAVAVLVNTELLVQDAKAKGVEIGEAAVETEYQKILADMGDEEVLRLTLKDMKITDTDLRDDIARQLAVEQHVQASTNIDALSVTNAEVKAYYDNVNANNADLPSFDNIKEELSAQLLQQKQQQVVSDFIQTLRSSATIEVLI